MKTTLKTHILSVLGMALCALVIAVNYSPTVQALKEIPDIIYVKDDEHSYALSGLPATFHVSTNYDYAAVSSSGDERLDNPENAESVTINLLGIIPLKTVTLYKCESRTLVPGGQSIGIAIYTKGSLVVGTSEIITESGTIPSPAAAAGVNVGDLIVAANGIETNSAEELSQICNQNKGEITLTVERGSDILYVELKAVLDTYDNTYKMGIWARDSTAGIGTLSFYDPDSLEYAALGHAVSDIDTNSQFTVQDGEISACSIVDIQYGSPGTPGKLYGSFGSSSDKLGNIELNCELGIYGTLYDATDTAFALKDIPLATPDEVQTGDAILITTVTGSEPIEYSCKVIKTYHQTSAQAKGLVIEITDSELLALTGGIVQGMSGSPIVQNGKLAAIVTHVMVNNPTRGYCTYAFWMAQNIDDQP